MTDVDVINDARSDALKELYAILVDSLADGDEESDAVAAFKRGMAINSRAFNLALDALEGK